MSDWWHKLTNFLDHYRYTFMGLVLAVAAVGTLLGAMGCESRTVGLVPGASGAPVAVTRQELQLQVVDVEKTLDGQRVELDAAVAKHNRAVAAFNAKVELATADLERQDQLKREILDAAGAVALQAASGTFNPVGLIPIAVGILGGLVGIGATADNRRKDAVIKSNGTAPAAPSV